MPFSVLRVMKSDDKHIEVIGEFWDTEIAQKFADMMQSDEESGKDFEYLVESPHPIATATDE